MFLHSVPPVLRLLVLPVPPERAPKGRKKVTFRAAASQTVSAPARPGGQI